MSLKLSIGIVVWHAFDLKLHHHWNKPLWTIEIYYFLKSCGVEVTFFTKFLGVGQHHSNIEWYSEHLDEDTRRIEDLLAATRENNWLVVQRSISLSEFLDYLNKSTVAIVLVDIHLLSSVSSCVSSENEEYVGHYIVVVGYQHEMIAYLDPALSSDIQWMSFELFESARKSTGTDEDIIFCHKSSNFSHIPSFLRTLTHNGERFFRLFFSSVFNSSHPHHLQQHQ